MKKIDRRNLIRGLAALPVAALAPTQNTFSQRTTRTNPDGEGATCPPNQLCIKFHGVWAFAFLPGRIVAVTPCVEEHSYWIGNGTQGQHLLRGKYHLDNVTGVSSAGPDANAITGIEEIDLARAYLWMVLPAAKISQAYGQSSISLCMGGSAQPPQDPNACKSKVMKLATTHFFQYDYQGSNIVFNSSINVTKDPGDSEFHIRAEQLRGPGFKKDRNHLYRAVDQLVTLFPKLQMQGVKAIDNVRTDLPSSSDVCGAQFSVQP